jgi:elongation factor P--beta-lysine ligase
MTLASILQHVATLPEVRKQELIQKHLENSLSESDKEELKNHIAQAMVRLDDEAKTAKDLLESL